MGRGCRLFRLMCPCLKICRGRASVIFLAPCALMLFGLQKNSRFIWINGSGDSILQRLIEGHDKVYIPGEPEIAIQKERMQNGIPLLRPVIEDLESIGQ